MHNRNCFAQGSITRLPLRSIDSVHYTADSDIMIILLTTPYNLKIHAVCRQTTHRYPAHTPNTDDIWRTGSGAATGPPYTLGPHLTTFLGPAFWYTAVFEAEHRQHRMELLTVISLRG